MVAVEAWVTWRRAVHAVAVAGGATAPRDGLLGLLADWWQTEGLPPSRELTAIDANRVLARIDDLHWQSRPFTALPN